jgi:hypothetical protein
MGIGVSIFLIAVGAVMTFALNVQNHSGVNLDTVGVILMVVGALGLLASLTIFGSWGGRRGGDVVVEDRRVL